MNPAKGRDFDPNDYAGMLKKYEADVKVQYLPLNMDKQYPITITDQMFRKAFLSWENLQDFVNTLTDSLYSGAYIDEYNYTKEIVTRAYKDNKAQIVKISNPNTQELAKEFLVKCRTLFKDFQEPTSEFNAWAKCGGYGRAVKTWTDKEDIILIIRTDISSYLDVNVLAQAFNIDKATLLGNMLEVKDFNVYGDNNELVIDGSKILGIVCDKAWFKIKTQDMYMDNSKNANNRTWNYYLNYIKMYQMSLFANGVILATEEPTVATTGFTVKTTDLNVTKGTKKIIEFETVPVTSNDQITVSNDGTNTTTTVEGRNKIIVDVKGDEEKSTLKVTIKAGSAQQDVNLTVKDV